MFEGLYTRLTLVKGFFVILQGQKIATPSFIEMMILSVMLTIISGLTLTLADAGMAASVLTQAQCWPIMENNGLSTRFPIKAVHITHSLTLQDIWHYFDSNATTENHVPTVNRDLDAAKAILEHAPNVGYEDKFATMALRGVDEILSHMDNPRYITLGHYGPLGQLVHRLHMQEMWGKSGQLYQDLVLSPPSNQVCACVTDVANNGVLKMLHYIAMTNRYTQDMTGVAFMLDRLHPDTYKYDPNEFMQCINPNKTKAEESDELVSVLMHVKDENGNDWTRHIDKVVPLKDEASWQLWKNMILHMHDVDCYDAAVFLYCTLNK